jgi:hypothetical protein
VPRATVTRSDLPVIGRSYAGSSRSGLSWVLNAYAIIFAALLVPAGRLADHFGETRVACEKLRIRQSLRAIDGMPTPNVRPKPSVDFTT